MNRIKILALAAVAVFMANAHTPKTTTDLSNLLKKVVADGNYIFGHADDTAYGRYWEYIPGRSDVLEIVGDYPGLINWDLGHLELDMINNIDGVPFDLMQREITNQDLRGGINSVSWHLRNPVTFGTAWDTSNPNTVKEVVTEGTDANKRMKEWIGLTADFIGNMKDPYGNRIPVLYRPWHEHTGSWFWWGKNHCTPEQYKALWKMTRKIFDEKGIDNVLWVYSPDKVYSEAEYMERYPGDELIDVMGADIYDSADNRDPKVYFANVKAGLDIASKLAKKHNKILAFTETGQENLPVADWFTDSLMPAVEGYPIAFVCVWRNAWLNRKDQFFAPFPGHPSADSFMKFYQSPKTLFAKDLKQ